LHDRLRAGRHLAGDAHRLVLHYALPFERRYLARRPVAIRRLTRAIPGVTVEAEPRR
jgi:hypothetical protein